MYKNNFDPLYSTLGQVFDEVSAKYWNTITRRGDSVMIIFHVKMLQRTGAKACHAKLHGVSY